MEIPECIASSRVELKDHQLRIVNALLEGTKRAIGVIHTTGSGKTLSAVVSAKCFLSSREEGFVYVVTPASLRDNYIKEFNKAYGEFDPRIQIFTPESFATNPQNLSDSMLIVDEAHYFRTKIVNSQDEAKKGKKANVLINQAISAKKVVLLTATPVVNTEYDLENLLALIDGRKPISERSFIQLLQNPAEKRKMLEGRFDFYYPSSEELKFYPSLEVTPVFFSMPKGIYQEYLRQENFLKGKNLDQLIQDSELEGDLTKFYTGLRFAANLKEGESSFEFDKASWIASNMKKTNGEKWLIYSEFITYGIDIVSDILVENGIPFYKITGKIPPDHRQQIVDSVNTPLDPNDPSIALLITRAGGTGLDLKGFSNVVIFESAWNFAVTDQVFGRAVRYKSLEGTPFTKVKGYLMMMVKPHEYAAGVERVINTFGNLYNKELKSIDLLLYSRAQAKKKRVDNLIEDMKIYNSDFKKFSESLELGARKIISDLKDFKIDLTCNPLTFDISSDIADIDSHTIIFIPNEFFTVKFNFELFEFPCLSTSAMFRSFHIPQNSGIILKESKPGFVKIFGVAETMSSTEVIFDRLIDDIKKKFTSKTHTDALLYIINGITPWVRISEPSWNHGKFILANLWLKNASTCFAQIVSKYTGDGLFAVGGFEIAGRAINLFFEYSKYEKIT